MIVRGSINLVPIRARRNANSPDILTTPKLNLGNYFGTKQEYWPKIVSNETLTNLD